MKSFSIIALALAATACISGTAVAQQKAENANKIKAYVQFEKGKPMNVALEPKQDGTKFFYMDKMPPSATSSTSRLLRILLPLPRRMPAAISKAPVSSWQLPRTSTRLMWACPATPAPKLLCLNWNALSAR